MMRDLDRIKPAEWTPEEAYEHLTMTFNIACKQFADIMEPWAIRVEGCANRAERQETMRDALRKTINDRWPY